MGANARSGFFVNLPPAPAETARKRGKRVKA
jgi:hypothetical protein